MVFVEDNFEMLVIDFVYKNFHYHKVTNITYIGGTRYARHIGFIGD